MSCDCFPRTHPHPHMHIPPPRHPPPHASSALDTMCAELNGHKHSKQPETADRRETTTSVQKSKDSGMSHVSNETYETNQMRPTIETQNNRKLREGTRRQQQCERVSTKIHHIGQKRPIYKVRQTRQKRPIYRQKRPHVVKRPREHYGPTIHH